MKKTKVLVLCTHGRNRSRYLAEYLRRKGYEAVYAGATAADPDKLQRMTDEVDVVVTVHSAVREKLNELDIRPGGRVIELDVEDRPEYTHPDKKSLNGEEWVKFQEEEVYPKLIEQIERSLPLWVIAYANSGGFRGQNSRYSQVSTPLVQGVLFHYDTSVSLCSR